MPSNNKNNQLPPPMAVVVINFQKEDLKGYFYLQPVLGVLKALKREPW